MSREHVKIFGQLIEALNAADLEGLYAHFDPDLVYYSRADEPDAIVGGGLEDFKEMIVTWTSMFEEFRCDIEEIVDAGDRTISVTALRGRGRESGVEVDEPYVFLVTWRKDKALEVHEYRTKEEALEAAGWLRD
jgi:ketosteroid isomerase-like protein